jgi:PAS domain S-box-containing protein
MSSIIFQRSGVIDVSSFERTSRETFPALKGILSIDDPREACADNADGDAQVRSASGELRLVAWASHMIRDAEGVLQYVVATGTDVTEARATEARLRESEQRFRELAEKVNDLVAELVENGVYTYVNKQFEKVLGWPAAEYIGRPVGEHMHRVDLALARAGLERLRAPEEARRGVLRVRNKDGDYRSLEVVVRSFVGPGKRVRIAMIARDITQRVAAEDELRRVDRLVTLGTFAAGVAHEINNPVAAILLAAEVALERPRARGPEMQAAATTLDNIAAHARRCGAIVRSMLDFATHGRSERRKHETNDLVARALSLVEGYANERGATLQLRCTPGPLVIRCNDVEIEQVLVNLVRNGVESGKSNVVIAIETRKHDDRVEISVTDNGDGIPADAREVVFEPFFSSKRASGGTGLGLAITRRIVADHGGEIRIEDPETRGTRFVVELPLVLQPPLAKEPTS